MRLLIVLIISFQFSSLFSKCYVQLEILTDNFPTETYWILEDENGNIIDQISAGDLICSNTYYNWDIIVILQFAIHLPYMIVMEMVYVVQKVVVLIVLITMLSYSGGSFHHDETVNNIYLLQ